VYFRSKHPTLGVELQIREVDSGFPAPKILPFATKTLTSAQVNTSTDASLATSFTFDSPVFLQAGLEFGAFSTTTSSSLSDSSLKIILFFFGFRRKNSAKLI
jgi:hypothetical protein